MYSLPSSSSRKTKKATGRIPDIQKSVLARI
uniref:Uncharacterized protein n=1 Tax=Siphoviridae sp. ctzyE57 TaxID=2827982 RepID=A0A8S5SGE5_9CAUD|nr:MAG TPA: hypothetical protein [Siphoviridae sp. ctzyE57]